MGHEYTNGGGRVYSCIRGEFVDGIHEEFADGSRGSAEARADLRALAPLIAVLGGAEAVGETFRAIQDVDRW